MGEDFEPWLERELRQAVGSVPGPSPRADQAGYRGLARRRRGPLAFVGAKGGVVIAAAAIAVGLGATGATAMTGSANPLSWGQRVVQAVSSCRDQASRDAQPGADAGVPDMGRCVSAFAGQADPSPGRSAASPSPGPRVPDPSPSPIQSGVLKQSLAKDGDQSQPVGTQSDQQAQGGQGTQGAQSAQGSQGSQGDQSGHTDVGTQSGGKPPRPTDIAKRPSPRPRPTPGSGQ